MICFEARLENTLRQLNRLANVLGGISQDTLAQGLRCIIIRPLVEMERVLAEARRNNQPAYIAVPSDYARSSVVPADVKPIVRQSNEAALQKAMKLIAERLDKAKSVVVFLAYTVARHGLQLRAQKAIEALGCPFVTTLDLRPYGRIRSSVPRVGSRVLIFVRSGAASRTEGI